jgi:hypothetical protein
MVRRPSDWEIASQSAFRNFSSSFFSANGRIRRGELPNFSIDYLETLLGRSSDGRKVNSIFGEGVNPLMRKIRDGLARVGLPSDALLRHGNSRVVYGVALAKNFRDILFGLSTKPSYLLPTNNLNEQTQKLTAYWRNRWLSKRIRRDSILGDIARHTLSYPITHGARVALPNDQDSDLFA